MLQTPTFMDQSYPNFDVELKLQAMCVRVSADDLSLEMLKECGYNMFTRLYMPYMCGA